MNEPERSSPTRFYRCVRRAVRILFRALYRFRAEGLEHIPETGPALLVANHGSFLDPPLVGCGVMSREVHFVARASLFKGPLGPIIRRLSTIPLEDNAGDLRAIRTVIEHLAKGELVLIFPEGARTYDGRLQPFRDGVRLIARKSGCPVVPIAIEGAFEAWPRTRALPRLLGCRVRIRCGKAVPASELHGPDGNERLERTIDTMRLALRAELRSQTHGRFPKPGPADEPLHGPEPD